MDERVADGKLWMSQFLADELSTYIFLVYFVKPFIYVLLFFHIFKIVSSISERVEGKRMDGEVWIRGVATK